MTFTLISALMRAEQSPPKPARDVAFCISALALSDNAFKKFMDAWKLYEPALYDREVFKHLDAVVAKAKALL